jgi:hypothetical protein
MKKNENVLSRRQFARDLARNAALGTAATLVPGCLPAGSASNKPTANGPSWQTASNTSGLSPQSLAEAENRYRTILEQYPDRFSAEQKTDLHRLCLLLEPPLERIRASSIGNSDLPALYLKPLVERERKSNSSKAAGKPDASPGRPAKSTAPGKP